MSNYRKSFLIHRYDESKATWRGFVSKFYGAFNSIMHVQCTWI